MPANVIELTATYREEDIHHALIFVDMLGFGELTRRNPHRITDREAEPGSVVSSTSRLQTQLVRFQRVIDNLIASQAPHGGVSAQVFSDCVYIDVGRFSRRAVDLAPGLMRDFILAEVPVRMGIGMGTYYAFRHSLEQADDQLVARSLFAGTGVVFAHDAEACGAKGCRILVHPSAEDSLRHHKHDSRLMSLPTELKGVRTELCYLATEAQEDQFDSREGRRRIVDQDLLLLRHIDGIEHGSEPMPDEVRIHYTDTRAAINRMRAKTRGTSLDEAAEQEQAINDEVDAAGDQGD
jgi:hypothetical protein